MCNVEIKIEQLKGLPDKARVEVYSGQERVAYWTMNKSAAENLKKGNRVGMYTDRIEAIKNKLVRATQWTIKQKN